jgi:hypothetical protein
LLFENLEVSRQLSAVSLFALSCVEGSAIGSRPETPQIARDDLFADG